jgi:hypothetical protein
VPTFVAVGPVWRRPRRNTVIVVARWVAVCVIASVTSTWSNSTSLTRDIGTSVVLFAMLLAFDGMRYARWRRAQTVAGTEQDPANEVG